MGDFAIRWSISIGFVRFVGTARLVVVAENNLVDSSETKYRNDRSSMK